MRKRLFLLVMLAAIISGCSPEEKPVPEPPVVEELVIEEPITLMDDVCEIEGAANVVYIPNEHVSDAWYPNIYGLGEHLLAVSYPEYYEGDEAQEQNVPNIELKLISLRNGELIKKVELPYIMGEVQIWGEKAVISDPQTGKVTILDKDLNVELEYELTPNPMETWYVSEDLETLYISEWDAGLSKYNLITGQREDLLEGAVDSYLTKDNNGNMFCHYTDLATQKNMVTCISLKTGEKERVPLEYDIGYDCSMAGDSWLVLSASDMGKYYFHDGEMQKEIPYEGNGIQLLDDKILLTKERAVFLYDINGEYLSGFELPGTELTFINNMLVWNEYWNGYFMVEYRDGNHRLLFWDIQKESQGENLVFQEPEDRIGEMVSLELYERANQISDRFGVDIHIADLCEETYAEYTCSYETDEEDITFALDMLVDYMEDYPEGFFKQLTYGDHGPLRIELVTNLQRDDGVDPSAAFVWGHIMVIDSWSVTEANFYHEVSHIIDQKLAFDAGLYEEALYSEEKWLSLQPEGFDYAYSYVDHYLLDVDCDYFVSTYSATFPTEDRAELLDYAMRDVVEFEKDGALYKKLEYYSHCIRGCFDTVGWPMVTMWEEPLYQ